MNRALRAALAALESHGEQSLADQLRSVYARKRSPPKRIGGTTQKERKKERVAARSARIAAIRAAVMARAGGLCEACGWSCPAASLELDHLLRGSGVRRTHESVETTWAACAVCHVARTHRRPPPRGVASFADWPTVERWHLQRHGITPHPLIVRSWARAEAHKGEGA